VSFDFLVEAFAQSRPPEKLLLCSGNGGSIPELTYCTAQGNVRLWLFSDGGATAISR
jgi:hypothetical protein